MICKNCGTHLNNEATVCHNCGVEVERGERRERKMRVYKQPGGADGSKPNKKGGNNNPPAMSLVQYIYMLVITAVPVFGIVMAFMWAFNKKDNPNRKNLAGAILVADGIILIVFVIISVVFNKFIAEFFINYFSLFK